MRALIALLFLVLPAQAQAEVIRAEDFPDGTDVTHLGLFSPTWGPGTTVVKGDEFAPIFEPPGYRATLDFTRAPTCAPSEPLKMLGLFLGELTFLHVDGALLLACASDGVLFEETYSGDPVPFFWVFGPEGLPVHIREIEYHRAPEPTILWLLLALAVTSYLLVTKKL